MDLIGDIELQGEIIKRRRVISVVVVVIAALVALAATIAVSAKEGSRNMRKRKRDVIHFYKRIINSNETDCFDQIHMSIDTPTLNQSSASGRENPSASSRRLKRKKGSMVGSLDSICEVIRDLSASLREPLKVDKSSGLKNYEGDVYNALKAIPGLSEGTMLDAYDNFLREPAIARGFLIMNEGERVTYIIRKFGGL